MGNYYDITDKTTRLALAYGVHNVNNQNGKLVKHKTLAVGSDLQVSIQTALGLGEWTSVEKLIYGGADIPNQNYIFHPGAPGETAADAIFPADVNHPGASFINTNLPLGMAADNDPTKLVGKFKTRKVADYLSSGSQTDFGFSQNFARCGLDAIKVIRPRLLSKIEYGSFLEWKAWCDELITITVNNVSVQVKRFECNLFFIPPFTLESLLDRLAVLSATEWQWRKGKIRFMPGVNRTPEFTFDLAQVSPNDFKFSSLTGTNRPNGVRISWRDQDDDLLKEADPLEFKRPDLIALDGGVENFLEFNAGVVRKNQAERIGNYLARLKCDLTDFAKIVGSWKSYPVLPADLVKVTHDIPDWIDKICKVVKKEENDDGGIGYPFYLQIQPSNPYSDTDHTPLVTRTKPTAPNPYSAPPSPVLTLSEDSLLLNNGTIQKSVLGHLTFGTYGFAQYAKIYWMKPAGAYELFTELSPDLNNLATFRVTDLPPGLNYFKAVAFSFLGVANLNVGGDVAQTVAAFNFTIDDRPIVDASDRSLTGFDSYGRFRGRDIGVVPQAAVLARIDMASSSDGIVSDALIGVTFANLGNDAQGKPINNNSDSVTAIQVDVYNSFGEMLVTFSPGNAGSIGGQFVAKFPRKYADPLSGQAYFKIKIYNYFGFNQPVYLQGAVVTMATPPLKLRANCPLEASGAPFSSSAVRTIYQFSGNVNLNRRKLDETAWTQHAAGISSSPYNAIGLAENTVYEFQYESASAPPNKSNIFRAQTKQQGEAAPARPAPTGISGGANSANPNTQLDFSCISAANVETEVFVGGSLATTLSAVAVGAAINYSISGLSASTSRSVKFRHKYAVNDYSDFTEELTRMTAAAPQEPQPPVIDYATYDEATDTINAGFTPHGGSGTYQTEYKFAGGTYVAAQPNLSANATTFQIHITQTATARTVFVKMIRSDVQIAYSNEVEVYIPAYDTGGGYGGGGECFAGETMVNVNLYQQISFEAIYKARESFLGREILSFDKNTNRTTMRRILAVMRTKSKTFVVAEFSNGLKIKATPKHPFWTAENKMVAVGDLKPGDQVYNPDFALLSLVSLKKKTVKNAQWFYNLTIDVDHTYFVGLGVSNRSPNNL